MNKAVVVAVIGVAIIVAASVGDLTSWHGIALWTCGMVAGMATEAWFRL